MAQKADTIQEVRDEGGAFPRVRGPGGPALRRCRPAAGRVLIRVAATSFNPVDAAIRSGFLQQVFPVALPHTPGIDVAGTLAEIGEGVAGWSVGEAVVGFLPMTEDGASAEFVPAPAEE